MKNIKLALSCALILTAYAVTSAASTKVTAKWKPLSALCLDNGICSVVRMCTSLPLGQLACYVSWTDGDRTLTVGNPQTAASSTASKNEPLTVTYHFANGNYTAQQAPGESVTITFEPTTTTSETTETL